MPIVVSYLGELDEHSFGAEDVGDVDSSEHTPVGVVLGTVVLVSSLVVAVVIPAIGGC